MRSLGVVFLGFCFFAYSLPAKAGEFPRESDRYLNEVGAHQTGQILGPVMMLSALIPAALAVQDVVNNQDSIEILAGIALTALFFGTGACVYALTPTPDPKKRFKSNM